MVLRCPNPTSLDLPPYVINDDDLVEWLISKGEKACLHVNLIKLNANGVHGSNIREMPVHNRGEDLNCIMNDNVEDDETIRQPELQISMHNVEVSPLVDDDEVDDDDDDDGVEASTEGENIIIACADSLRNGSNDIASIVVLEAENVIPNSSPMRVSSWSIPYDEDVHVGDEFLTKDDLILRMTVLAIDHSFEFKRGPSDKKLVVFKCANQDCSWRLQATSVGSREESTSESPSKKFVVRIYKSDHSCSSLIHQARHKQATSKFVSRIIEEKFLDSTRNYPPKDVITDFQSKYGPKLTYDVAHDAQKKAKEAVRGTPSENFRRLPKFFYCLEKANPGTKTYIETYRNSNVFKYCFMALGQCIRGYSSSILPVICVDGTFLSGAYRGVLLEAVCHDAQRKLYPLAFAIVKSESNDSWRWFFRKLKKITGDKSELVILADRAPSIKNGFKKVFKNARYGNCCLHMKKNLESKYPKTNLAHLFKKAYKAYTVHEFEEWFGLLSNNVKSRFEKSAKPCDFDEYLDADEYQFWSRAHFDGHRYHHMTTNAAESFNSKIKKVRGFPVVALLKSIRLILQDWFAKRNQRAQRMKGVLTPIMEAKMKKRIQHMRDAKLTVNVIRNNLEYEVCVGEKSFVVDFEKLTCTCKRFDLKKFPCIHAIRAAKEISKPFESLCSEYHFSSYYKTSYSESIYPPVNEDEIEYPESVLIREVVPPLMDNGKGRPGTNRKKGVGEKRKRTKDTQCRGSGEEIGETNNEPHKHTLALEEEPRDYMENQRKKDKECGGSGEQLGETSNEPREHTTALEDQPLTSRNKKPKKYASIDSLMSRAL